MVPKLKSEWCPYCAARVQFTLERAGMGYPSANLVHCSADDGGCDRSFVVMASLEMETTVHRIEGVS